jgi:glucosamine--fructose-6-phosphate aminotransferase (isomerizing)
VPGGLTSRAIASQPAWLALLTVEQRLPAAASALFTGCGTSYHAARAIGTAAHALDVAMGDHPPADILVAISHEGASALTLEAVERWSGPVWTITGAPESPIARASDVVVVATPEAEQSYCHTASYTCAVAAGRALRGEDITPLSQRVAAALTADPLPVSDHERWLLVGAGADWPTALEATLKLREAAHVTAEAHQTEQLLHGHLAAIDASVRCFVLEGVGRAAERARDAVSALRELGCDVTLVPTSHPVVDVVPFQRLAVAVADARGVDPDVIRWDEPAWKRARDTYA